MKINILPIFVICIALISCNNRTDIEKEISSNSGILSAENISVDNVKIPEINAFRETTTLNGMGTTFFYITPIGKLFLDEECIQGKRVVDIGCSFSDIPIKAIEKGVSEYTANDLSEDHLKILVKKAIGIVSKNKLSNLKILCGKAPEIMLKLQGKYDAILADKSIHFLTPNEIERFIELAKSLLKPKGRIYVTASSIYSPLGSNNDYKKQYAQRLKEGKKFPGHFPDVMTRLGESQEVADEMVLFSRSDLENVFKKHGMKIIFSCSLKLPEQNSLGWTVFEGESYDNPSDFVGIIAEKND